MGDFPEKIWMNIDYEDGGLMDWSSRQLSPSASEYIRADLVPQWQTIDTLTTNERVIVLFDNDHIDSGWLDNIDERRFFRTGHGKLPLTRLNHWMPIPKVPE